MFASLDLVSIVDGDRQDDRKITEIAVVQPKSLFGLRGEASRLLIVTDPPGGYGSDANRLVIEAISSTYLRDSSGSITSRLARALQESNRALRDENAATVSYQRNYLSALCAVVSPDEAYFAQVGPSLILLVRSGQLQQLGEKASALSSTSMGRDFGFEVRYSHTALEPGDILILSSPGLARITKRDQLLSYLTRPDKSSLGDRIHQLYEDAPTHADLTAIAARLKPGRSEERVQRRSGDEERDGSSEAGLAARPGQMDFGKRRFRPAAEENPRSSARTPMGEAGYSRVDTTEPQTPTEPHASRVVERLKLQPEPDRREQAKPRPSSRPPARSSANTASHGAPPRRSSPAEEENSIPAFLRSRVVEEIRRQALSAEMPLVEQSKTSPDAALARVSRRDPGRAATPEVEPGDPPPPIRDVVIQFKGSKVDTSALSSVVPASLLGGAVGDRAVEMAQESVALMFDYISSARRVFLALLLPLAVLAILGALGFIFLRGYQIQEQHQELKSRPAIDEAAQLEQDALATQDPSLKRRLLAQADQLASSTADARKDDREAASSNSRIRSELDKVSSITRLSSAEVLVDLSRENASPESLAMLMQGIDVYVLDRDASRIYKYLLDSAGNRVQPSSGPLLMRKGDTFGGVVVNNLAAMAWIPAGGARARGVLAALDSSGTAFEYDPTKGISAIGFTNSDFLARQAIVRGQAGNLYVLDPRKGKLSWYPPSQTSYGQTVYGYFNPDTPVDLSTAVDFALDGSLYVLHRNGQVQKFFAGRLQPFQAIIPDAQLKSPTFIFSSPATRSVYVVDAGNSRVVQLSKEGAFERQLLFGGSEDLFRGAKGISVDEKKGILYVISGKKVFALALENKRP